MMMKKTQDKTDESSHEDKAIMKNVQLYICFAATNFTKIVQKMNYEKLIEKLLTTTAEF